MGAPELSDRPLLLGCDFSSSPSRHKPIVMALGEGARGQIKLHQLQFFDTLDAWGQWLSEPRSWMGGFDLPFGLPRELVQSLGWPTEWRACADHYARLDRTEIRRLFAAFCDARPVGGKFAHRRTDGPAGSSPSMKWVNPPVAYMMHAGLPRLLHAGVHLPGLHAGDRARVALEAYPGMLAREVLGQRGYKSDDKARQTPERLLARKDLITALELGQTRLRLRLRLTHAQRDRLIDDAKGDSLDAVLCMVQAAWAAQQGAPLYGLPPDFDPLEGWIVSAAA